MAPGPNKKATLLSLLQSLEERLKHHLGAAQQGKSRCAGPLRSISETVDSFLTDDIAESNAYFAQLWPSDKEISEPSLVQAFVSLVSAVRELDPPLQKTFDKLVPRKVKSEVTFWRRYLAHAHALLLRLSPTAEEAITELVARLPPPRPAESRRFAPADPPLQTEGELSAETLIALLKELSEAMGSAESARSAP